MRYLLAAIAVLTCPCHLPIWIAVLASTAIGTAMTSHTGLALVALTALFVTSAGGAIRLFSVRPGASPPRRPG